MKFISVFKTIGNNVFVALLLLTASIGSANAALIYNFGTGGKLIGVQNVLVRIGAVGGVGPRHRHSVEILQARCRRYHPDGNTRWNRTG